ncbi:hypothetical protein Pint_26344 [Pistacia integerrima]|uniref:Uncharacterized protein n=1 Tax=Pistacia integerrima TaxID=434235 RepID=A0ACC0YCZ4_9ROSI|nr:hypothetical protein Pint_26344 [Pistacia integerrima]
MSNSHLYNIVKLYNHIYLSFAELAYNMNVIEKCDVYGFGLLTPEIIKGNHPRDFLSSFPSSSSNVNLALTDLLDPRLATPSHDGQDKLISIMEVAFSCLDSNPESRPTMEVVCQRLTCTRPSKYVACDLSLPRKALT